MQNLNLINLEKSDIKYDIIEFNDGEPHIKFKSEVNRKDRVQVLCRICSPRDLFVLMQVGDILNRMEVDWALIITYLMGMRMDRVVSFNESYSLKVVAHTINDMHPSIVYIVEPHSTKSISLIQNARSIDSRFLGMIEELDNANEYIFVFPDTGAKDRYYSVNTTLPVLTCKKHRDPDTGVLSDFEIENPEILDTLPELPPEHEYKFFVVDDLCDAGGTLCGVSDLLSKIRPSFKRVLAVTHAVNLKGIIKTNSYYDYLYISNSYYDWEKDEYIKVHNNITVIPVEEVYFNM